jgi:hypothetical protein
MEHFIGDVQLLPARGSAHPGDQVKSLILGYVFPRHDDPGGGADSARCAEGGGQLFDAGGLCFGLLSQFAIRCRSKVTCCSSISARSCSCSIRCSSCSTLGSGRAISQTIPVVAGQEAAHPPEWRRLPRPEMLASGHLAGPAHP